jgi:large subunit ribosomal protein L24
MRIKKNDQVKVNLGKSSGKTGKVLRVFPAENKIIVEGLNLIKKHMRPKKEGEKGQRVEIPGKMNVSNAMLVCPKCGKTTRVGSKQLGDKKVRVCKKCQAEI